MIRGRLTTWLLWLAVYAATTVGMYFVSGIPDIRVSHAVLVYLLLIIVASRQGGRALSLVMVLFGYLAVDLLFVPPRLSFGAATDLDWIVLIGFLATGWLVSELFAKQQEATRVAEERTREVERLSAERLQLEREASTARVLREADRLKNALLNSMAHDLRSPVSTLALLADPAAGFPGDIALARVGEEARRLGEYIATLQRFATDGGGSMLALETLEAERLVHTALRSAEGILGGRRVQLAAETDRVWVSCDLTLSVQVVGNLLQNAARYSPEDQTIDVFVADRGGLAEIVVADRGPGISAEDVERLFVPLRRPPRPTPWNDDPYSTRMGMGLAIARTFARAQRGDVVYRAREGGGSEFVLQLPHAARA